MFIATDLVLYRETVYFVRNVWLSSKSKTKTFRLAKFVSNAIEIRNEFTRSD